MDKRLIPALISEYEKIPDDELYDVFSFVYRASEYGFELFTKDMIKQIKSRVPIEQATPSSYENEDKIIVYRGIGSKSNVDGYSWTTDPDIAIFFAKRFDKNGLIFVGKIKAKKILFEFESDKEVIIDPSEVEELDKIPVEDFIDQHRNTDLSMKNI